MKRTAILTSALLAILFPVVSCDRDDVDMPNGKLTFFLTDGGEEIEGTQTILYGDSKEYHLSTSFVTSLKVSAPEGWDARFYPDSELTVITAPDIEDRQAEMSGEIKVEAGGPGGQTMDYSLNVAAQEPGVEVSFIDDVSSVVEFGFGDEQMFRIVAANTAELEISTPDGWSGSYDLETQPATITILSPSSEPGNETSGKVRVLPKSIKGTVGEAASFDVVLVTTIPTLQFDSPSEEFTGFGESREIGFTSTNIATMELITEREGWNVNIDLAESKITVTSPASGSDGFGNVVFTLKATSETDHTTTADLYAAVRVQSGGIASAQDFEEFGAAVTAGTSIDKYMAGTEVVLLLDIDMTGSTLNTVVGSHEKPFTGNFNGNGRTILIENSEIEVPEWGLFHTAATGAVIRDLKVKGTLRSTFAPETSNAVAHHVSPVLLYNDGAKIENISTDVEFTYQPATFVNYHQALSPASSNQQYDYTYGGVYGGITARVTGVESLYENCRADGIIHMNNGALSHVGNIIGRISVDDHQSGKYVTVRNCVNNGRLDLQFIGSANGSKYGGVIGDADNYEITVQDCTNNGNIDLAFSGANLVFAVGGIVGAMYGTIDGCTNNGNITQSSGNTADRRLGGIVGNAGFHIADAIGGGNGNNLKDFVMTNCHNTGNITHCSQMTGGLIGTLQRTNARGEVISCTNRGTIEGYKTGEANGNQTHTQGGIAGQYSGSLMKDCVNYGKITGYCRIHCGGLVGRGQQYTSNTERAMEVVNCRNEGDIDVRTVERAASAGNNLRVAGIAIMENGNWSFENCSNSGILTPTLEDAEGCRNIYFNRSSSNTVNLDAASQSEQDDTSAPRINPTVMP